MDFSDCVYDNDELFQKEKSFNVLLSILNLTSKTIHHRKKIALLNSQQKQFYEALRGLKPSYQQVIILRRIQGFSTKETSSILNWSEGKVKMSLSRALAAFKKELEKGGFTNESLI